MEPSLSLLMRLVRACGLDLRIWLEPADRQFEGLVDHQLALSIEDRLRGVESAIRFASEIALER